MAQCPDIITIQSLIDGEEKDSVILNHVGECAKCGKNYRELETTVKLADRLGSTITLPSSFYSALTVKAAPRAFPAVPAAAAIFFLALISAYLANPAFIQWWFSVGITRQIGQLIDLILNLFYLSHAAGPNIIIPALAAMVLLEVVILNFLRNMEGHGNV